MFALLRRSLFSGGKQMREISTKKIEVGEHIIVDGVEYVAEKHDGNCLQCDVACCGDWFLIPCEDGLILKRVEKQPTDEHGKDTPMTNIQLAEWLAKGLGQCKCGTGKHIFTNMTINEDEENLAIDYRILIRPWGTDEWVRPTLEIYRRDCR